MGFNCNQLQLQRQPQPLKVLLQRQPQPLQVLELWHRLQSQLLKFFLLCQPHLQQLWTQLSLFGRKSFDAKERLLRYQSLFSLKCNHLLHLRRNGRLSRCAYAMQKNRRLPLHLHKKKGLSGCADPLQSNHQRLLHLRRKSGLSGCCACPLQ